MNALDVALPDYAGYDDVRFRGRFTMVASGTGIASNADSGSFVCHPFDYDGSISARVVSVQATSPNSIGGVMIRENLALDSPYVYTAMNPSSGVIVQSRTVSGEVASSSVTNGAINTPYWMRVVRAGSSFTQFISSDSATWTSVGTVNVNMNTIAEACLASSSAKMNDTSEALYDSVSVVPSPWLASDVGNPLPGWTTFDGTQFTLSAAGSGFQSASDGGHLLCQQLTGDGSITARVASEEVVGGGTYQAGVMLRETIAANSRFMYMFIPSSGTAFTHYRATPGAGHIAASTTAGVPTWVRVTKTGNVYTSYKSSNGSSWEIVASVTLDMGSSPLACLASSSRAVSAVGQSVFDNVSVM